MIMRMQEFMGFMSQRFMQELLVKGFDFRIVV